MHSLHFCRSWSNSIDQENFPWEMSLIPRKPVIVPTKWPRIFWKFHQRIENILPNHNAQTQFDERCNKSTNHWIKDFLQGLFFQLVLLYRYYRIWLSEISCHCEPSSIAQTITADIDRKSAQIIHLPWDLYPSNLFTPTSSLCFHFVFASL